VHFNSAAFDYAVVKEEELPDELWKGSLENMSILNEMEM